MDKECRFGELELSYDWSSIVPPTPPPPPPQYCSAWLDCLKSATWFFIFAVCCLMYISCSSLNLVFFSLVICCFFLSAFSSPKGSPYTTFGIHIIRGCSSRVYEVLHHLVVYFFANYEFWDHFGFIFYFWGINIFANH